MVWDIVWAVIIGGLITLIGFSIYGIAMAGPSDSKTSLLKKVFGSISGVLFFLGAWVIYRGVIGQEPHIKIICGVGAGLVLLSVLMAITLPSFEEINEIIDIDYGD